MPDLPAGHEQQHTEELDLLTPPSNRLPPVPKPDQLTSSSSSCSHPPSSALSHRRSGRRSQIVRNSLHGAVQLLLPTPGFPNLPRGRLMIGGDPSLGEQKLKPPKGQPRRHTEGSRALAAAESRFRAKTVFFYRDGDNYFTGVRIPVSKARFRTMDALLDQLNESIPLPFGVRQLHTPAGNTPVRSLEELQSQGRYIAASGSPLRRVRGVDLEAVERRRKLREEAQRRWNFQQPNPSGREATSEATGAGTKAEEDGHPGGPGTMASGQQPGQGQGQPRGSPFVPVTSKQVFFVLNGHPHRVYRALINPIRRQGDLESLLEEVSEGLSSAIFRLYSFDGDRILSLDQLLRLKDMRAVAVPRHERLLLNGLTHSDILRPAARQPGSSSLPPIGKPSSKSVSSKSTSKSSSGGSASMRAADRLPSNNIDRLSSYSRAAASLPKVEDHLNGRAASTHKRRKKSSRSPLDFKDVASLATATSAAVSLGGSAAGVGGRPFSASMPPPSAAGRMAARPQTVGQQSQQQHTGTPSNATADSDSGRPRTGIEAERIGEEKESGEGEEQGKEGHGEEEQVKMAQGRGQGEQESGSAEGEQQREEGEGRGEEGEEEEEEDEDDYPEEPPELRAIHFASAVDSAGLTRRKERREQEEEKKSDHRSKGNGGGGEASNGGSERMTAGRRSTEGARGLPTRGDLPTFGIYSEELEQILYGQAAVKIQSAWRGYAVRKELKHCRFAEQPTYINTTPASRRKPSRRLGEYKPNERHQALLHREKSPAELQKSPTSVLKKSSFLLEAEAPMDSSSDREDGTHGTELLAQRKSLDWEIPEKTPSSGGQRTPRDDYVYTVTVITGNRWAADTEADLYVVLHGTNTDSGKLWLRQEFTNWLQSGTNGQRFRQNKSDSFLFRLPTRLGILRQLTVGHEHRGYGAGIFIDRILVTEDEESSQPKEEQQEDCRQFLFLCTKWLDSGQVDGKLERTVRLSAFYELGSIPVDNRVTRGRWELILHSGTDKGLGGTSSQLAITGYGTRGQSTSTGLYDSRMAKVPSESLIQVDFGDIGELLKVRVQIDGSGPSPDYFLNFAEFKDLDTEERFVVMCGRWMRWESGKKGEQPFRELLAFHIGVEPLPLISYEGKLRLLRSRLECVGTSELQLELHGDLGETGQIRIDIPHTGATKGDDPSAEQEEQIGDKENEGRSDKTDVPFKLEAVSVGRLSGARLHFRGSQMGEQIFEGLLLLQNIFQKQGVWPLASNSDFLVSRVLVRENAHTPYRYLLTRSQLSQRRDSGTDLLVKELLATELEGVSTRVPGRRREQRVPANWLLQMSLAECSTLLPEVTLCGEHCSAKMVTPSEGTVDGMLSYQLEQPLPDIGPLRKIRIFADGKKLLVTAGGSADEKAEKKDGQTAVAEAKGPFAQVEKIRLADGANGEEVRFPAADCCLERHSVFELSAIWPDTPPIPIVIYGVRVVAGQANSSSPALAVRLNLTGELGDVGWRTLNMEGLEGASPRQPVALFAPNTRSSFEFEAVSIGEIECAQMEVLSEQADFLWECAELVVTDTNSALFYTFNFPNPFSAAHPSQQSSVLPFTNGL